MMSSHRTHCLRVSRVLPLLMGALISSGGARWLAAQQAPRDTAIASARRAAETWLAVVDSGNHGASWDSAATAFRAAVSRADWERAVTQARGPLEPFGARRLVGSEYLVNPPGAPPGQYVVLQYETAAGNGQRVAETVTPMRERTGEWRVSGYYVRPL